MIVPVSALTAGFYQYLAKPLLFQLNPEVVHLTMVEIGEFMGQIPLARNLLSLAFSYQHPSLEQTIHGLHFANPIGLAAGFDYEAKLTQVLNSVGFGYQSIGTVTYGFYPGNPRPMLGRLPRSRSLMVNKGFKSPGAPAVISKLSSLEFPIPLGVSIGSTNKQYLSLKDQIAEYI
jgi:hypothetical protein